METALPIAEAELLEGLKTDRPGAFEDLFNKYWKDLYESAYYRLKDQSEAEDIVQDIFTSVWQRRHSLEITTTLKGYLHTALKYNIIKLASSASLHQEAVEHLLHRMEDMEGTILDVLIAEDVKLTLEEAVRSFPENMKKIFSLRAENFSVAEIAEALGLSKQTVKNNNTEALRRLKVIMMEKHPDINKSFYVLLLLLMKS
ncbi:RNA polymerase sigma-70 factor [Mucilaginibacter gynuensis]|uniref:RNA polymerase sigma-70 factor n=1 Tax=Mucilaginibacter gynuensis TaxID=1302236 RepID=A0ABP8FSR8_9SPHI